jgi:nitric oxide reductase NorD protein
MGPAIRHAVARLRGQPTRLKLLVMISDGYPQDRDYGPDRDDDEYGIQDTAQALREAQQAGVLSFCITVDPAGHDYLRRMCPDDRYLVIDEVAALPRELAKVYRALTP